MVTEKLGKQGIRDGVQSCLAHFTNAAIVQLKGVHRYVLVAKITAEELENAKHCLDRSEKMYQVGEHPDFGTVIRIFYPSSICQENEDIKLKDGSFEVISPKIPDVKPPSENSGGSKKGKVKSISKKKKKQEDKSINELTLHEKLQRVQTLIKHLFGKNGFKKFEPTQVVKKDTLKINFSGFEFLETACNLVRDKLDTFPKKEFVQINSSEREVDKAQGKLNISFTDEETLTELGKYLEKEK